MSSRDFILGKLRVARQPFTDIPPVTTRRLMVPEIEGSLLDQFVAEAQTLSCDVTRCAGPDEALECLLALLGDDRRLLSWDPAYIPLPGLPEALDRTGIEIAPPEDASVRVGVTGVDAALASTGSLILTAGPGKPRTVSLLPDIHVAVITTAQIVPNLESWSADRHAQGLDDFRQLSSVTIVSGPSRTADIAMQLVLGAHGPAALHILILP
jgi:L-lactate dehydrogenase complex protein LldG